MHAQKSSNEHRDRRRTRRAGFLAWRVPGSNLEQTGWLLESSQHGAAFAWRGERAPAPETIIETREDGCLRQNPWRPAAVRHARVLHDNLCVIGVEHVNLGSDKGSLIHGGPPSPFTNIKLKPPKTRSDEEIDLGSAFLEPDAVLLSRGA